MKTITFPSHTAFNYVEVWEVIEWKNGAIYRTKKKGFALKSRPQKENEVYSSLSTLLTRQPTITLNLLD